MLTLDWNQCNFGDAYLHDELLVQKLSFVVIYKITHFTLLH